MSNKNESSSAFTQEDFEHMHTQAVGLLVEHYGIDTVTATHAIKCGVLASLMQEVRPMD